MKTLLATALVSTLLCAPALADPPPPSNIVLSFEINDGTGVRRLGLILTDRKCGSIESNGGATSDEVKACVNTEGADAVRVDVDWHTKWGTNDVRSKSVLLMHRTQVQQLDAGPAKLDVKATWPAPAVTPTSP
jgi:hypothetical protein